MSDEDDCSVAEGRRLADDERAICSVLDTAPAGPLAPVSEFVNRLKGLKPDPTRVIVAALVGDAEAGPDLEAQRDLYIASLEHNKTCHHDAYICRSGNGIAEWGRRYQQLVDGFGPHGIHQNICSSSDFAPAMRALAYRIRDVVDRICLPQPLHDDTRLLVERRGADGAVVEVLEEGVDYAVYAYGGRDCDVDGAPRPAILFYAEATARIGSDEVIVSYRAAPALDP